MTFDVYKTIAKDHPPEAKRIRYCRGCEYLEYVAGHGCCCYMLKTSIRRGCKFGSPDCKAKKLMNGYVIPPEHLDFCRQVDEEERLEAERKRKHDEWLRSLSDDAEQAASKQESDKQPDWDVEYAHKLYLEGYHIYEIVEIVGVSKIRLRNYISNNGWPGELPPYFTRANHDIDVAKMEYDEYKRRNKKPEE